MGGEARARCLRGILEQQRDLRSRRHAHLGAHGAHLGDQPHDPVHLRLDRGIDQRSVRPGPRPVDQQRPVPVGHLRVQLLGDERHHRMEHEQDLVQSPGGGGAGLGLRRGAAAAEGRLGELQVPVTEGAPGELIKRGGKFVESIGFQRRRSLLGRFGHLADEPTVDRLQAARRIEASHRGAAVHLAEPRGIPQLGAEIAIAFDPALRHLHVVPLDGERGQGKTQGVGAVGVDQPQRVDDVALGLGHLLALLVTDQCMDIDGVERHAAHEVQPHHHHPGDPEEDDIETGDQHIGGIVTAQLRRLLGPAEGRERPQGRREPSIEHIGIAGQVHRLAVVRAGRGACLLLGKLDEDRPVGPVPSGNLVPPPDLPGYAPGLDVVHPFVVRLRPIPWNETGAPLLHRRDRRTGQGLRVDEPLVHQPRLDDHAGTVAVGHHHHVVLDLVEQAEGLHLPNDRVARLVAIEVPVTLGRVLVHAGAGVENVDHLEVVTAAHLEVIEVVSRGDLHRAGPFFRIGMGVGDDRDWPVDDRQNAAATNQVRIARVVRMDRDGGIAEHGLRSGGRHADELVGTALDWIAEGPQVAVNLALLHLQIGNRGVQQRVPVDQPLVAVDQPLLVEIDEHLAHRRRQALVHGEPFPRPVAGCAQAAELAGDGAAGFRLPLPHPFDEALPAQVVTGQAVLVHLPLDHHLGGDTGVVGARLPEGVAPAHPRVPDQDVLKRAVEGVAHVQAAGNVGRRNDDGERLRLGAPAAGEGTRALPCRVPPVLYLLGPIGFLEHRPEALSTNKPVREGPARKLRRCC